MKKRFSKNIIFVSIALIIIVSGSFYFMNSKSPSSSSSNLTLLNTTAEEKIKAPLPKNSSQDVRPIKTDLIAVNSIPKKIKESVIKDLKTKNNNGDYEEQKDAKPDKLKNSETPETYDQPMKSDLSLSQPSSDNISSISTGEYSDQINQDAIIKRAIQDGYQIPMINSDSHSPTSQNIVPEPQEEYREEIQQQTIIEKAKSEGFHPPEVDPDSHPPTNQNITSGP